MILEDLSKIRVKAVKNLVKQGVYTVDYAIMQADCINDKGKLVAGDYEGLMNYLIEIQCKDEVAETENTVEDVENEEVTEIEENTNAEV